MPRIVRFEEYGGPEVLKIFEEALQEPGPGEVRLKVQAIGLNRAEVMLRTGKYVTVPEFPARIGIEAAGLVDDVGAGVTDVKVGELVSAVPFLSWDRWGNWIPDSVVKYGVYGDSAIVPAWTIARNAKGTSATDGAAAWCQYLTAWGGLIDFGGLNDQSIVVISAASSSAGLGAIQIAKSEGALTIAVTRGPAKRKALMEAGADQVIVTETEDFATRVKQITAGQGFTLAYDPIGGAFVNDLIAAAMPGGIIVNYGNLSSENVNFYVLSMLAKRLTIKSHSVFDTMRDPVARERGKRYIVDRMRSGILRPIISRVFPLADIVAAHRFMESNEQAGKIVVVT